MRIAVTGASGQIGSRLRDRLAASHDVQGFDLKPAPNVVALDVGAPETGSVLRGFEVVCHLAAVISVPESVQNPVLYARTNVLGTVHVLEAARRSDSRVVFVSTAAVYGDPQSDPITEDHPTQPASPYGLSKLEGEQFARLFHRLYGLDVSIVRPFNVYSESLTPDNPYAGVIATFLLNARSGRPLEIHGDGHQSRDFVHVSDVVQLLEILTRTKGEGEAYNCGTGTATTILGLAQLVRERFDPGLAFVHTAPRIGDVRHGRPDISRARSLGFAPRIRLSEWIRALPAGSGSRVTPSGVPQRPADVV